MRIGERLMDPLCCDNADLHCG